MSFMDIVSKFNQQADSHSRSQSLNPFSDHFEQSRSPSPRFSREEYGKPVAGSKTDLRGRRAKSHICREILELCTIIHDVGTYNAKKKHGEDDEDDGTIIISFGELFQIYTKISDKVVGLLIAAKRRGFLYFDREILFQRQDDDVLIALLKPISEIGKILKEDIEQASAPVEPTPVDPAPVEKKKPSADKTRRPSRPAEPHGETSTTEVYGGRPETNGFNNSYCNGEVDSGGGGGGGESSMLNNVVEISESEEGGGRTRAEAADGGAVHDETGEVDGSKSPEKAGETARTAESSSETSAETVHAFCDPAAVENAQTEKSGGSPVEAAAPVGSPGGGVDETVTEHVETEKFDETDAGEVGGAEIEEVDETVTEHVETENPDETAAVTGAAVGGTPSEQVVGAVETEKFDETDAGQVGGAEIGGVDETVTGDVESEGSDETVAVTGTAVDGTQSELVAGVVETVWFDETDAGELDDGSGTRVSADNFGGEAKAERESVRSDDRTEVAKSEAEVGESAAALNETESETFRN